MKVSLSVKAFKSLQESIRKIAGLKPDYFHVDCLDEPADFELVRFLREHTSIPIDFHLITPAPAAYLPLFKKYKIEKCALQYEQINGKIDPLIFQELKIGLSINANTPIEEVSGYFEHVDHIQLMSGTPGIGGASFDNKNIQKLIFLNNCHPDIEVQIDGGVNNFTAQKLAGFENVKCMVSGSYIEKSKSWREAMTVLKNNKEYI